MSWASRSVMAAQSGKGSGSLHGMLASWPRTYGPSSGERIVLMDETSRACAWDVSRLHNWHGEGQGQSVTVVRRDAKPLLDGVLLLKGQLVTCVVPVLR